MVVLVKLYLSNTKNIFESLFPSADDDSDKFANIAFVRSLRLAINTCAEITVMHLEQRAED